MQIILIQDVDNLGQKNELVSVKNGYARNFLIPQKFAVEASPSNMKQLQERLKVQKVKEEKLLAEIAKVVEVFESFSC
ncbi:ribosomal protein L9 [Chitinophaga sp. W3I9]|uniref:50S ribosomal protein L9 n=1 Tax=Chitinophaga sp. W3I9 TaxID=3373924 RepID=UPI003D20F229